MLRPPSKPIPLTDLRAGAEVRLHEARVDHECREWLRALGLTDASDLRLCKHGDPCIIQVRSTRIGLSKAVASRVFVLDGESTVTP
jgi:Fe2+ transport system protein FeoA